MRIFVTGATGLIGRRLVVDRLERGDQVVVLSRDARVAKRRFAAAANRNVTVLEGDPSAPGEWQRSVDGCDAVVHLAGAGIADRRWSSVYRRAIADSRLDSTYQVAKAITRADRPPAVLVSASAVGFYGDTGHRSVDESSPSGGGVLAELGVRWEELACRARGAGTRVVLLRIAPVLDERGGLLGRMTPLFRLGLGGPWGPGDQYVSWVHWRDLVGIVGFAIVKADLDGPLNAVAPGLVTARQFARDLGRVLRRPVFVPAPTPALRLVIGAMAEHLAESSRVVPRRLTDAGYRFLYPVLEDALRSLLTPAARPTPPVASVTVASRDAPTGNSDAADAGESIASPPAAVRLLAVGVDGTLLRSDGHLPHGVVQACRAAERAGCVVVPATARAPRAMDPVARALELTGPIIVSNGAVIWNPRARIPQHHQPIDRVLVEELIELVRSRHPQVLVALESIDSWHTDRLDQRFEDGPVLEPDQIGPLHQFYGLPLTRIEIAGAADIMADVITMLRERYWQSRRVGMFVTDAHVVQITHPLVDKSIALQRIAARLGLDRRQVMAIGDGENDQGMIEWAGFGVAVGNARASVKRLADEIVASNDELGVAGAIQRFILMRSGGDGT